MMKKLYLRVWDEWFGGIVPMKWRDDEVQLIIGRHPMPDLGLLDQDEMDNLVDVINPLRADLRERGFDAAFVIE